MKYDFFRFAIIESPIFKRRTFHFRKIVSLIWKQRLFNYFSCSTDGRGCLLCQDSIPLRQPLASVGILSIPSSSTNETTVTDSSSTEESFQRFHRVRVFKVRVLNRRKFSKWIETIWSFNQFIDSINRIIDKPFDHSNNSIENTFRNSSKSTNRILWNLLRSPFTLYLFGQ